MKIKLSELKTLLHESIKQLQEDYEADDNDEIDLAKPTIVLKNKYGPEDQETSTKVAHAHLNFDPYNDEGEEDDDEPFDLVSLVQNNNYK